MKKNLRIYSPKELEIRNNGLIEVTRLLESLEIEYFLTDGTLLGAVREKDFIPWDWDVEITVLSSSIYNKFAELIELSKKYGFEVSSLDTDPANLKLNLNKDNNKYSLNGLSAEGQYMTRKAYIYPKKFFESKSDIEFRGKLYPTVSNVKDYLAYQYGDWETPTLSPFNKKKYLSHSVRRDSGVYSRIVSLLKRIYNLSKLNLSKLLRYFGIERSSRERNFIFMYSHSLEKNSNIIEIGSSDCSEIISALSNINFPHAIKTIIVEPSKKNILTSKRSIKRNLKNCNDIKFINAAIGESSSSKEFFLSKSRPNLNSFTKLPLHTSSEVIKTLTLQEVYESQDLQTPLFIKMDIEGYEAKLLNSNVDFLRNLNNVKILIEVHPISYNPDNCMKSALTALFDAGFDVLNVESAGKPIPINFKRENYKPFKIENNRGLYEGISKEFVLKNATENIQDTIEDGSMNLKQIRSILIHKG